MTNDLLDDLLSIEEDNSILDEENGKLAPLLAEINLIDNESIRNFVRAILYAADSFWEAPSTGTAGYHPPDEIMPRGGITHTKRVVRLARMMALSQERNRHEVDIITAAALIHDVTKSHNHNGEFTFDAMHPYTIDHFVAVVMANEDKTGPGPKSSKAIEIDHDDCALILRIVRCHLGPWSPIPETFPMTLMEWILHFADMIATQLHVIIDGEDVQDWRWIASEQGCGPEVSGSDLP